MMNRLHAFIRKRLEVDGWKPLPLFMEKTGHGDGSGAMKKGKAIVFIRDIAERFSQFIEHKGA